MGYSVPNQTPDYGAALGASSQPRSSAAAGIGRRLLAGLIDAVILAVGFLVCLFIVGFSFGIAGADDQTMQSDLPLWIAIGLWLAFGWFYTSLLESSPAQATLGKMALRIQVADLTGQRVSLARATLRYWTKSVFTVITLGIAFFVAAFSERHQALYDIVAGTIVLPRGARVAQAVETPLRMADPASVELLRARTTLPSDRKSPMSGKRLEKALAALARVAEPGERPVAAANALVGPSPFVVHMLLGSLGGLLLLKPELLWVTDRRILLIQLSRWNRRPKGVTLALPRSSVALFRAESRTLWLRQADGTEYRLNQVRKAEATWVSQALGGPLAP
jgi:uncharacterized RDD family membrane protein YckC